MNKVAGKTFDISPVCDIFTGRGKADEGLLCGEDTEYFCSNALLTNDIRYIREKACCKAHFKTFYSLTKYNGYILKKDEETGNWEEIEVGEEDAPIPDTPTPVEEMLWERTGKTEEGLLPSVAE
jgi:hypothetical protein